MDPIQFGVHCMTHRTNLVVETLSNLPIVSKLEALCQEIYVYFNHISKHHLEFQKLANLVETEGHYMLCNVKTWWISLLDTLRRIIGEYKTLVAKMCQDSTVKELELKVKQAIVQKTRQGTITMLGLC